MNKTPFVTVLMSEYNTDIEQLKISVESILNQTYKNFELIIIDDCGNPKLKEIIDTYNDKRIKIYKNQKNSGLAISLNNGIKRAKGEYIIRMDTDDISMPERIEKQVKFIVNNPKYSIIGSRYILFDDNGEYNILGHKGEINKKQFLHGTPFAHPTLLIRKNDIINSGLYPNYRRIQDYAMEMQMYYKGYKGYVMEDVLLKYREDNNAYKKKKYKYRIMEYKIRKKYFKLLNLPWYRFIYEIKPLIVGLIPSKIIKKIHRSNIQRSKTER